MCPILNLVFLLMIWLKFVSGADSSLQEKKISEFCATKNSSIVPVINHIAFTVAREIQGEPGNTLFSPLGISMALGMAYLGAQGETAQQMEDAFGYKTWGLERNEVHINIRQLCDDLMERSGDQYELNVANGFFSDLGLRINESHAEEITKYYHGSAEYLDFRYSVGDVFDYLNYWTKSKTSGKVQNILWNTLPRDTKLLLINAIYFKGTWKIEFPVAETRQEYFYVAGGGPRDLPVSLMMLNGETYMFLRDKESGYKYLELPYKGGEISMLLALPLQYDQKPDLVMTPELFYRVRSTMAPTKIETVAIPKFKIEYRKSMKESLIAMGMVDAFTEGVANFSGIPNGHILDVLHKAVVEVNEQGSEPSSVSGEYIMPIIFKDIEEFIANRPFLFYIIHTKTDLVIFSGKVEKP